MQLDNASPNAPSVRLLAARGPPLSSHAPCDSYVNFSESFKFGHGGARSGAGRPRKPKPDPAPEVFRWYVVRTVHGQTDLADREIRDAGFEVVTAKIYRPATPSRRTASGTLIRAREERFEPLFVRYVIVLLNLADPSWHQIPQMKSVERIICGGYVDGRPGRPLAVSDEAIAWLRKFLVEGCHYPKGARRQGYREDPIEVGAVLRVRLSDEETSHAGVCDMSDGERVVMLMGWFNRDNVRTTVAQSSVEAV